MGELGNISNLDPYTQGFLEKIKLRLDEAYDRGDPIIILELDHLEDPQLGMIVEIFVNQYVKNKRDRKAYLRNVN